MGDMLQALCECGFKSKIILAGGGIVNFTHYCGAPAVCLHCQEFLIKNYKKKYSKCPSCGKKVTFYNDSSLQIPVSESYKNHKIFEWHINNEKVDFQLQDTQYFCPKCRKMTLTFECVGNWD
jgi:Zn finger protein HypA/HybF involved in hydrogenase expression